MLAAEFLKVLNTQLVGNNKMQKGRNQEKTASSAVGKQKLGIQLLSALGLVNSALSRVSMKLLEVGCYLTAAFNAQSSHSCTSSRKLYHFQ